MPVYRAEPHALTWQDALPVEQHVEVLTYVKDCSSFDLGVLADPVIITSHGHGVLKCSENL